MNGCGSNLELCILSREVIFICSYRVARNSESLISIMPFLICRFIIFLTSGSKSRFTRSNRRFSLFWDIWFEDNDELSSPQAYGCCKKCSFMKCAFCEFIWEWPSLDSSRIWDSSSLRFILELLFECPASSLPYPQISCAWSITDSQVQAWPIVNLF